MSASRPGTFRHAAHVSADFVAFLALIELADFALRHGFGATLDGLGIHPRSRAGLVGIVFSPLLHASWVHLAANALPLLVLLTLLFWDRYNQPGSTLAMIWVFSGLGTWWLGQPGTVHIGASSIIYGLAAYLVVAGVIRRSWRSVLVAVFVGAGFSGIWYGLLPQEGAVSWEGHLSGAVAGVIAAVANHRVRG